VAEPVRLPGQTGALVHQHMQRLIQFEVNRRKFNIKIKFVKWVEDALFGQAWSVFSRIRSASVREINRSIPGAMPP
jgi:hypothetical protein